MIFGASVALNIPPTIIVIIKRDMFVNGTYKSEYPNNRIKILNKSRFMSFLHKKLYEIYYSENHQKHST